MYWLTAISDAFQGRGGAGRVAMADAVYVVAGFSGHERQVSPPN